MLLVGKVGYLTSVLTPWLLVSPVMTLVSELIKEMLDSLLLLLFPSKEVAAEEDVDPPPQNVYIYS